jgi:hypothetical protein
VGYLSTPDSTVFSKSDDSHLTKDVDETSDAGDAAIIEEVDAAANNSALLLVSFLEIAVVEVVRGVFKGELYNTLHAIDILKDKKQSNESNGSMRRI